MNDFTLRRWVRPFPRWLLSKRASELNSADLRRSAIVFSPHFDDETLGCGGTIARKKMLGADIKLVFMTDGSKSHKDWISEQELSQIRTDEGLAAARTLGLAEDDVILLNFEETRLAEQRQAATEQVLQLLTRYQPQDVYVTYYREPPADHVVTNEIVWAAIKQYGRIENVYEYLIWFWQHWPWTSEEDLGKDKLRRIIKRTVLAELALFRECNRYVDVEDVMELKRAALAKHRSQTIRLFEKSDWPVLDDVSDGEFLECLLQAREFFHHRKTSALL
jgi:LmbE family N-acetylglucosaminyl deacetylase